LKPAPFDYARAATLAEALELIGRGGAGVRVLAGGQSLVPALNMRLDAPKLLVDINRIPGLGGIGRSADGGLRIGALARHVEIERAPLVREHAPLLALAAPHIAHPAIRNRGTLGGSLALADPAAEWPACLMALDATILLKSSARERRVKAGDFFRGLYETALEPGELIVGCEIAPRAKESCSGFEEFPRRRGDYAMAGLAAEGIFAKGRFTALRLIYFALQSTPIAAVAAAEILGAGTCDEARLEKAQEALVRDLAPHGDLNASPAMKLHLARVLLARVVAAMVPRFKIGKPAS
jgi:aerobic carbon-monoxide dehydrogenase medium subunit